MNYEELVKALRLETDYVAVEKTMRDAADAIEALQAEVDTLKRTDSKRCQECLYLGQPVGEQLLPKRGEWNLTNDEIETIRIHMNAIKEQLCNQYRHREAETYQTIVDKLAKMEVQE